MGSSVKSAGMLSEVKKERRGGGEGASERAAHHVTIGRSLSRAGHMTDWKRSLLPENDSQKLRLRV